MKNPIYIQLLEEGTKVFRPVLSEEIRNKVYVVGGKDIYDPKNEVWEFLPDTIVTVEEKSLEGEIVLVAVHLEKRNK